MLDRGWIDKPDLDALYAGIRRDVDAAVEWAEACPYPDPAEVCHNVYDLP
jgi:TPP-dependent pyruvate/acetoin dehydrogenase alpha subunit